MTGGTADFESLLQQALRPIDPPTDLADRLEETLIELTERAADELESWEVGAMRDPRNWGRPAAAMVVGGTAGAALLLVRSRRRQQRKAASQRLGRAAAGAARGVLGEARRIARG